MSDSMKILPLGAELFHADGRTDRRTDMTKLIVVLQNFANAPKSGWTFSFRGKDIKSCKLLVGSVREKQLAWGP